MAIAGLHNVSVVDSSFLMESQPEAVRRQGNDGSGSTRASSILQMWRELEDEHVVSHSQRRANERLFQQRSGRLGSDLSGLDVSDSRGSEHSGADSISIGESEYGQWSPGPIGSENGQEDSSDMGMVERERVRQIFREWMNTSVRECTSNVSPSNNGSRSEWLGETEQERVRIIREWVQLNSQHRGACADHREEQSAEVVGQIEQVLDGSVVNAVDGRTEQTRRGIRRLCGRQVLLDMLKKAERERQKELQGLLEHRAVSQFAHRSRIQSLLRGRFLRNDRTIEGGRSTSTAASELGLLRQRHTVSDLREGFFSRLDHSASVQVNGSTSDTSSHTDMDGNRDDAAQENNIQHARGEFHEQIESSNWEIGNYRLKEWRTNMECVVIEDTRLPESAPCTEEESGRVVENGTTNMQQSPDDEFFGRRDNTEVVSGNSCESSNGEPSSFETVENESREPIVQLLSCEVFSQPPEPNGDGSATPVFSDYMNGSEGNFVEDARRHETAPAEQQNQDLESEGRGLLGGSLESNEWGDTTQVNIDAYQSEIMSNDLLENEDIGHQNETISHEFFGTEDGEGAQTWHEGDGFQEAVQDWLAEPPNQEAVPVGRMDPFYLPDDDNVYNMELRELLSRRSVSTLLRSGFRESLDQLIQSYVQRQSHPSLEVDWEGQGTSPTPESAEQDLEQQNGDQNEGLGDAIGSAPFAPPSPRLPPVQNLWDSESPRYDWPQHDVHNRFGIEWDIINDLRIDMARLQQRMNNMQRMLEACMDMQLELQRSIRQEVSAALNRSAAGSPGVCESNWQEDRSKWDHVRKGMCCICCDSSIDSLLYRCGHMCTCSKCANKLVQSGEKCPMCRAPVIEVIRAYSIL